eukprot:302646_1
MVSLVKRITISNVMIINLLLLSQIIFYHKLHGVYSKINGETFDPPVLINDKFKHYHYITNTNDTYINDTQLIDSNINFSMEMLQWQKVHSIHFTKKINIHSINDTAFIVHHNAREDTYISGTKFAKGLWWDEDSLSSIINHINLLFSEFSVNITAIKQKQKTDVIGLVDIGANIGSYSIGFGVHFLTRYPFINIYSFEPLWKNYMLLISSINKNKLSNVYLYPYGLTENMTDLNDTVSFIIDKTNKGHSHIKNNVTWIRPGEDKGGEIVSINTIKIDALQQFIKQKSWKNTLWMKIDTEGHEFNVLKGAKEYLINYGPCFIKSEFTLNREEQIEFMSNIGYDIYWRSFNWSSINQNQTNRLELNNIYKFKLPDLMEVIYVKHNVQQCIRRKLKYLI